MDGYIKKSDAVDVILKYPYNISGKTATAIRMIEDLPDADVVPKSEVESIFDELIKQVGEIAENYKKEADGTSVSEFARIEYRGTQIGALLVQYKIAELKKKYIGE